MHWLMMVSVLVFAWLHDTSAWGVQESPKQQSKLIAKAKQPGAARAKGAARTQGGQAPRSKQTKASEAGAKRSTGRRTGSRGSRSPQKKERLPRFYGQLDLKSEQRASITSIQREYQDKLDRLYTELADLRQQREKRLQETLTRSQRKELSRLLHAPRAPSAAKRDSNPRQADTET